jgi:hypothetical protein
MLRILIVGVSSLNSDFRGICGEMLEEKPAMTLAENAHFITLSQQGLETTASAELSTHLRKHVMTD